ncbi:magnesium/cobalt transporter CorA [Antarcticibacterium flavum]|uniref:Magnesium transport protein CorA n=1 Tax=Antarcticibacterium flavum TaxID=2058175 RepID=A0A5B7WXV4_9FLAO|nr:MULTISPECIES: magnesium/cobalt transporter CorA [Antarcticibacterium]MCM4160806.1 magnesium and cobalt transport protein CorA [Antarcticibacterium sp. W02-3]QCY67976.1 magnesium/cobalt transporter CorA [Antarcticibacterium flavum]
MVKRTRLLLRRPKSTKALNQPPGTVTYIGRKESAETRLEVIDYNKESFERYTSTRPEDAFDFENENKTTWINIDGLSNTAEIEKLGKYYNLHPLILEDIVNTNQRPKIDEYQDFIFVVVKMLYFPKEATSKTNGNLVSEHVSFVVGEDYVLSFQEAGGDVFDGVRERLENGKGRIRGNGADYLLFCLLDAIIDNYFEVIDHMGDQIEFLEEDLFQKQPSDDITFQIQELKRTILRIRRAVFPLREVLSRLEKMDTNLIQEKTRNYFRDLYDHITQVSENIEIYREMTWGLMDMYMTTISNKMNEVMKVLTIIATIFIPLTFIAGIYGMNFEFMPELQWKYSYFVLWGIMLMVFVVMLYFFRKKKWL